jgi:hypothetical protein
MKHFIIESLKVKYMSKQFVLDALDILAVRVEIYGIDNLIDKSDIDDILESIGCLRCKMEELL